MAVYRFKISFEDYEDVYREIDIPSDLTFSQFYSSILASIGFEDHGIASFYMSNDSWKKGTEITNAEGKQKDGNPVAQIAHAALKNYIADPHQKIYLTIESESTWAFHIELIKILAAKEAQQTYPFLKKSIGDAPKQFKVVIPPAVLDEDLIQEEDLAEDNETSDDYTSNQEYDEEDATSLEGEEGEEEDTEKDDDMDDVEMSDDDNYEEEN